MRKLRLSVWALAAAAVLGLAPSAQAIGILVPTDRSLPPLSLRSHAVEVTIDNQVARTRVTQVFHNDLGQALEAHYLFPVPRGAQVTDFVLYINGKPVPAEMMERDQARQIYEDIVRRMRDPGLLEYLDHDLFRVRIYPVPARGDQKVEIEFAQTLTMDGGAAQYVYPMGMQGRESRPAPGGDFRFQFAIESKSPIKTVYSPSHRLQLNRQGDKRVQGSILGGEAGGEQDVTLVYTVSPDDIGLNVLAYREDPKQPGFFLVMVAPKVQIDERDIQPKAVTFILDTSGSMAADGKIEQARGALKYCLDSLRPKDRFNIVRFASDVDSFRPELVAADEANRGRAHKWIEGFRASGGTNIDEALAAALAARLPQGYVHTVVLLTDGRPTIGETNPQAILENLRKRNEAELRIFAFGVGYDVNAPLLDQMAEDSRAVSQYVRPAEDIEQAVSTFFDKIASPVLTDLELEIAGVQTVDVFPRKLPDLFLGGQLTVFGRYKNPGKAKVILTGNLEGRRTKFEYEASFPRQNDRYNYIEPLWGYRKVGYLLDEIRRHGESQEVVDEVIALAKRYGIVTPYTSYLVTDDTEMEQLERQRALSSRRPEKWMVFWDKPGSEGAVPRPTPTPQPQAWDRRAKGAAAAPAARPLADMYGAVNRAESAAGALGSRQSFMAETGAEAVNASEELRKYKEASVARGPERAAERQASGRTFVKRNGVWSDQTIEGRAEVISVKLMSEAYFEALRIRPDLKEAASLGEQVEIRLDAKTVLRIGSEGKEQLDKADRGRLEQTRPAKD